MSRATTRHPAVSMPPPHHCHAITTATIIIIITSPSSPRCHHTETTTVIIIIISSPPHRPPPRVRRFTVLTKKGNQRDSFSNDTFRGRSLISSAVYYEVTPPGHTFAATCFLGCYKINHQKKLEEDAKAEAAKQEGEVRKSELVDLLGPEVVKKYYNDMLQYDKYRDKMLNRRAVSRITNCDVLTRKGPITLKVYREDGTSEIIPKFKASDLHLSEWREDPLDKLNDLANKKRKHVDDIHDYFKANKKLKSSVQYKDHLPGTMLNEPVLGMIMFNSYHRQDFITIEDLKDFSNTIYSRPQ
ncbi:hypothetical protein Tco_1438564 [Tanacetum coccineum]